MYFRAKNKELYITLDDVLNETSFSSKDVQDKLGENFVMVIERDLSRAVYRYLHGLHRGFDHNNHTRTLNALIFNNSNYQYAIKSAMIEMVKGAMYSGMDLNAYSAEVDPTPTGNATRKNIPDGVLHELRAGGLLDLAGNLVIDEETLFEIEALYPNQDTLLTV